MKHAQSENQEPVARYCCHSCFKVSGGVMLDRMILCSECGNKRCPKATDHNFSCTGSNDPGQLGSIYGTPPAAQAAPVQEPVVFYRCNGCGHAYEQVHPTSCDCMGAGGFDRVEYFTTPPAAQPEQVVDCPRCGHVCSQRPWVGLTDDEISTIAFDTRYVGLVGTAQAIEAKLKERNNG